MDNIRVDIKDTPTVTRYTCCKCKREVNYANVFFMPPPSAVAPPHPDEWVSVYGDGTHAICQFCFAEALGVPKQEQSDE